MSAMSATITTIQTEEQMREYLAYLQARKGSIIRRCDEFEAAIERAIATKSTATPVKAPAATAKAPKAAKEGKYILPFNGEVSNSLCEVILKNSGLYTQCPNKKTGTQYCEKCTQEMTKNADPNPKFGTVHDRMACGLYEYQDPTGKKVERYSKFMEKKGWTREEIVAHAKTLGITLDPEHFEVVEVKRGRPSKGEPKEPKEARPRGRPRTIKVEPAVDAIEALAGGVTAAAAPAASTAKASKDAEKAAAKALKDAEKAAEKAAAKALKDAEKAAAKAAKAGAKAPAATAAAVPEPEYRILEIDGDKYSVNKDGDVFDTIDGELVHVGTYDEVTSEVEFYDIEDEEDDA